MKTTRAAAILLAAFAFALTAQAAERIAGASLVEESEDIEAVLYDILVYPMDQSEIDLFLSQQDKVLDWAEANAALWVAAHEAEAPISAVRSFPIWREASLTSSEFIAIVGKLMFARDFASDPMDVAALRAQLAAIEKIQSDPKTPERRRLELYGAVGQLESLIKIIEAGAADKIALYRRNQAAVDEALERIERIGAE